jgi:hypothetical protein
LISTLTNVTGNTAGATALIHHCDLLSTGAARRKEDKFAIDSATDLMSAVHRAFALEILSKITTLMATFFRQPVRPICRLAISFYGAI